MLPMIKKRDSVHEDDVSPVTSVPQTSGLTLSVPSQDISRSVSPALEPMSARITDHEAEVFNAIDLNSELQFAPMSARVAI